VDEEWSEARIVHLCEEVLRGGRRHPSGPPAQQLDARTRFFFPPTLNSFERHLVHEVAERVGGAELSHASQGQGMERFILLQYVWKPQEKRAPVPDAAAAEPTAVEVASSAAIDASSSSTPAVGQSNKAAKKAAKKAADLLAAQQAQQVQDDKQAARQRAIDALELKTTGKVSATPIRPAAGVTVASASAASSAAAAAAAPGSAFAALADDAAVADAADDPGADEPSSAPSVARNNNKKKKKKASETVAEAAEEEDLDALLSEFSSAVCAQAGCGARVVVMGFDCAYCKKRWCTKHMNPVLHGCHEAHKVAQLAAAKKAHRALEAGSKPLKESDKIMLQQKLDKKIAADKQARTKQTKKDEKKK
jgi:hypothetical protein